MKASNAPTQRPPWWRSAGAKSLLKLMVGLLIVAALLSRLDLTTTIDALGRYRWPYLLLAFVLFVLSCPIAALRWKLFAPGTSLRKLLELTLIGQFYSIVLPGQIAGEVVKAYRLGRGNADAERLAASVFVDRVIGVIALLLVACAGIALSPHRLPEALLATIAAMMLLLFFGLFALRIPALHALALGSAHGISGTRLRRFAPALERAIAAWRHFSGTPSRLLLSLLLGIAFQLLAIGIYAVLGTNIGIDLTPFDWAWVVAVASVAVLLPLSIGGLGVREGALIGCLAFLGVPGESAVALSLGVFAVMLLGALLGGVLELAHHVRQAPQRNPIR